jgi:hypothetical protein
MNRGVLAVLLASSFAVSSPAWAIFNAQVLAVNRNAKFSSSGSQSDTLKGSELRAAAHLDPIPLVPIAFGLGISQTSWTDDSTKLGVDKIDGVDLDLEVEAWLPLELAGLVPYAKVGYTVGGAYAFEVTTGTSFNPKVVYKPSGVTLHVGVKYEFLLRLGIMAEYETGTRKLTFDKVKDAGSLTLSNLKDIDENSSSFLIGVQAGI